MPAVDTLGVFHQGTVYEVATVFMDDVQKAEAELDFGVEFEERQVNVASHADFQIEVKGFKSQGIMLAGSEVNHRIDACNEIGTEIVIARCRELQVNRHGNIGALENLGAICAAKLLVIDTMLLAKVNGGQDT